MVNLGLEFDDVSPFVLGKQIGALADDAERALVLKFLSVIDDPDDHLATAGRMARAVRLAPSDPERLRTRFNAFRRGLETRSCRGHGSSVG